MQAACFVRNYVMLNYFCRVLETSDNLGSKLADDPSDELAAYFEGDLACGRSISCERVHAALTARGFVCGGRARDHRRGRA